MNRLLVTGGAGFIGSALIRYLIQCTDYQVVNVDCLTYAGDLTALDSVSQSPQYTFIRGDICDASLLDSIFAEFRPSGVMHLAAETHVDRSIKGPGPFVQTNIVGTYTLLEAARKHFEGLSSSEQADFRFIHVSSDEVYGDLQGTDDLFTEQTKYAPSSPYSASKAGADHLVRAWHRTYRLPVLITNCSNNYGPYQFPEKLIPLMILHGVSGKRLPVYGEGDQVRDWLHVEDHVRALTHVLEQGTIGETYNIGSNNQTNNLTLVKSICEILEELAPKKPSGVTFYEDLIEFVQDRPGHDQKYGIDPSKLETELGWQAQESFASGLRKTVQWYLDNLTWYQKRFSNDLE